MRGFTSPSLLVRAATKLAAVTAAGIALGIAAMLQLPIHLLFLLLIFAPFPLFKVIWAEQKREKTRRRQEMRARLDAKYGPT